MLRTCYVRTSTRDDIESICTGMHHIAQMDTHCTNGHTLYTWTHTAQMDTHCTHTSSMRSMTAAVFLALRSDLISALVNASYKGLLRPLGASPRVFLMLCRRHR